nr:uncharacterized protein LOC128684422 [Cherax quadricarinatus]
MTQKEKLLGFFANSDSDESGLGYMFVDNSATFRDNKFVSANGKAFVNLCSVEELVWHNNSFVNVTTPPIRLQEPECETKRDWHTNISLTGLSCLDCEDFRNSDEQTCAIYQSGYCTSCTEHFDNCYKPLLSYLILEQCQDSHPSIAAELAQNCNLDQSAKPQPRLLTGSATSLIPLSLLLVAGIFFSVIN